MKTRNKAIITSLYKNYKPVTRQTKTNTKRTQTHYNIWRANAYINKQFFKDLPRCKGQRQKLQDANIKYNSSMENL